MFSKEDCVIAKDWFRSAETRLYFFNSGQMSFFDLLFIMTEFFLVLLAGNGINDTVQCYFDKVIYGGRSLNLWKKIVLLFSLFLFFMIVLTKKFFIPPKRDLLLSPFFKTVTFRS